MSNIAELKETTHSEQITEYLGNQCKIIDTSGYIYLLRPNSFRYGNMPIYKLGKAIIYTDRLQNYEKFSEVYAIYFVSNVDKVEQLLLSIFDTLYEQKKEHGKEYFSGNVFDMIKTLRYYLKRNYLLNKIDLYESLIENNMNRFIIYNTPTFNIKVYKYIQFIMNQLNLSIDISDIHKYNKFYYDHIMTRKDKKSIQLSEEVDDESEEEFEIDSETESVSDIEENIESSQTEENIEIPVQISAVQSDHPIQEVNSDSRKMKSIPLPEKDPDMNIDIGNEMYKDLFIPVKNKQLLKILHICHYCIEYKTTQRKDMIKHFQRKNNCRQVNDITYESAKQITLYKKFYMYIDDESIPTRDYLKIVKNNNEKRNYIDENYNQIRRVIQPRPMLIQTNEYVDIIDQKYYNASTSRYECNLCNSTFTSKQNMKKHILEKKSRCDERRKLLEMIAQNHGSTGASNL